MLDRMFLGGASGPSDPYYANVSLLVHGDGTDGSNVFTDSGPLKQTVNAFGNTKVSTAVKKFGTGSMAFDGAGDYLSVPHNSSFNVGTGNFTYELFVYPTNSGAYAQGLPNNHTYFRGGGFGIYLYYGTEPRAEITNVGGTDGAGVSGPLLTMNAWNHVAFVRNNGEVRVYTNGVSGTPATTFVNPDNSQPWEFGRYEGNLYYFSGYYDEFRLTKGIARYTSNFTPPTAPFPDQ